MSDFFLLPCAIAPPSLPTLAGLSYTHYAFHTRSAPPGPPLLSFFFCSVFTCNLSLNVQCLSCSGVLRPSQWIGSSFGEEVTAPPFLSFSLPPSPPPLLPQGRRPAWEMGPTCAAWWMAALLPLHVSRLPGGGRGCAARVSPPRPPASHSFELRESRITAAPSPRLSGTVGSRSRGPSSRSSPGAGRSKPGCSGRGRFVPPGQICCAV